MSFDRTFFQPQDAAEIPRYAGLPTFMRLPMLDISQVDEVDIALVGIPWDAGTTNRAGARHGPREVRNQSALMRRVHHVSLIAPYDLARVADLGDVALAPTGIEQGLAAIEAYLGQVRSAGVRPLSVGGDHLVTLPVFRGIVRDGPVGMVHFDAHSDTNDTYFGGQKYTHGTPFRRAVEEGLLDPKRTVQIGIRGSIYDAADEDFAKAVGIRVIHMEEFASRTMDDVLAEVRQIVGDGQTYVSFDVDCLDPAQAPGTGTPEIGGMSTREAQYMLRGLQGLNLIGADVVEVSPPFDVGGVTALVGATVAFELLCLLADAHASRGRLPLAIVEGVA